jgi:hypothetical protein
VAEIARHATPLTNNLFATTVPAGFRVAYGGAMRLAPDYAAVDTRQKTLDSKH